MGATGLFIARVLQMRWALVSVDWREPAHPSLSWALRIPASTQPHLPAILLPFQPPGLLWIPPSLQPFSSRLYHLRFSLPRTLFPSAFHLLIQLQPSLSLCSSFSLPVSSQVSPILGSFTLCPLSPLPRQFLACCLAHIGCSVTVYWTEFKSNLLFCKLCYVVSSPLSRVVWG